MTTHEMNAHINTFTPSETEALARALEGDTKGASELIVDIAKRIAFINEHGYC